MSRRKVVRTVQGISTSDGAGVNLVRIIGSPQLEMLDPFLLLDEFGSDDPDDYIGGFPDHPHRGFETVTYMLEGKFRHRDSQGNEGLLSDGAVQWMTAGRGVIHSEMPEQVEGRVRGFQLWVNLPAHLKMTDPEYQDIPADRIPVVPIEGGSVRVISGIFREIEGPARARIGMLYLDIQLQAKSQLVVPASDEWNLFVYPYGEGKRELWVYDRKGEVSLSGGEKGMNFLLIAGEPLNEPVARAGPFVMNTREEVAKAFQDYQDGILTG
jgi:redox-sensitive bicupin YhaK (pirin superfamily)